MLVDLDKWKINAKCKLCDADIFDDGYGWELDHRPQETVWISHDEFRCMIHFRNEIRKLRAEIDKLKKKNRSVNSVIETLRNYFHL